jgi:hypothetical protein
MFASPLASCIFVALFYKDMARHSRAREKKRCDTQTRKSEFQKIVVGIRTSEQPTSYLTLSPK